MQPFAYERAATQADALAAARVAPEATQYLAGGTNLLDLMKIGVLHPERLVDLAPLRNGQAEIRADGTGLYLGALAHMAEAAEHPLVVDGYPVIAQSLQLAASPQLRNMATLGGNVLQRTRCNYFRDSSWRQCNKLMPGSGCAAIDGVNRRLAVLGVSEHCIANYPGDFAVALVALEAQVDLLQVSGESRSLAFEDLHRLPCETPHIETMLEPGELIAGLRVPAGAWTRRSCYLKIRDRESYDFALASAAVALDLRDGIVHDARIGLGGLAAKPWRSHAAEAALRGRVLNETEAERVAEAAFRDAVTHGQNDYKPELGRRTLVRALVHAAALEI